MVDIQPEKSEPETIAEAVQKLGEATEEFWEAFRLGESLILIAQKVSKYTTRIQRMVLKSETGTYLFCPANEDDATDEDIAGKALAPRKWYVAIQGSGHECWAVARNKYDSVSWEFGYQYNWWQKQQLEDMGFVEKTWAEFCEFYEYEE